MRTTLDLPNTLLEEAMKATHQRTKTAVIIMALQDLVRRNRLQGLRKYRGKVDLDLDLGAARKRQ